MLMTNITVNSLMKSLSVSDFTRFKSMIDLV